MTIPKFTLSDIQYSEDPQMFKRAEQLFRSGKVGKIHEDGRGYSAIVQGTHPYDVSVSERRIDTGYCSCYMGQNDMLCKHMLALAIAVLDQTGGLVAEPKPSNLTEVKRRVSKGIGKLRAYTSPSKYWFSYQRGLATGCGITLEAIEGLPADEKNADFLWHIVLRICKKLATGGVDDSDGTVGNCVGEIIQQLKNYANEKPELKPKMLGYCSDDTGFGFEDELREMLQPAKAIGNAQSHLDKLGNVS